MELVYHVGMTESARLTQVDVDTYKRWVMDKCSVPKDKADMMLALVGEFKRIAKKNSGVIRLV